MNVLERRWAFKHQQNDLMRVLRRSVELAGETRHSWSNFVNFSCMSPFVPFVFPEKSGQLSQARIVRSSNGTIAELMSDYGTACLCNCFMRRLKWSRPGLI
jgi:hypothetical protein